MFREAVHRAQRPSTPSESPACPTAGPPTAPVQRTPGPCSGWGETDVGPSGSIPPSAHCAPRMELRHPGDEVTWGRRHHSSHSPQCARGRGCAGTSPPDSRTTAKAPACGWLSKVLFFAGNTRENSCFIILLTSLPRAFICPKKMGDNVQFTRFCEHNVSPSKMGMNPGTWRQSSRKAAAWRRPRSRTDTDRPVSTPAGGVFLSV